jgi:hypothetical protein
MASENPQWGTERIGGELLKLGLGRHGLAHGIGWGAATLVAAWLLLSGIVGFANP